jgi:hypothetical protein
MMLLNPGKERSGIVQAYVGAGMFLKHLNKRKVATRIGLLENVAEIAAGLMRVNEKSQMKLWRHRGALISWKTA